MSRKKRETRQQRRSGQRRARGTRFRWWIPVLLVIVVGVPAVWLVFRGNGPSPSGTGLPGPAGGRQVAQDVNTLVGQPAPPFTLASAEGRTYDVRLGRGRPTVLIFHMGLT